MSRWVLHVDMDAFFASVEQLTRPSLQGRPVLVGGIDGRGVVAGASYEARALGARSAQPMYQAIALVGYQGVSLMPRFSVYKAVSAKIFHILHEVAGGVVEQVSIDEGFIEPPSLQGCSEEEVRIFSEKLRKKILTEVGIHASVGAGSGRQYAKIASAKAKPNGVYIIPEERRREILDPMPVRTLWGIGPVTEKVLKNMGIESIGDFGHMNRAEVHSLFGKNGIQLWNLVVSGDPSPVEERAERKQISAEYTYTEDLLTREDADRALERAFRTAYSRLLKDGRAVKTVTVKLKMSDFHNETRSLSLSYGTDKQETLWAMAQKLMRYPDTVGAIRLIGVGFSGLSWEYQQILFHDEYENIQEEIHVDTPSENPVEGKTTRWKRGMDVHHPEYGHGWIQGVGHGFITVRFESRTRTSPTSKTFKENTSGLEIADPLNSLDWSKEDLLDYAQY